MEHSFEQEILDKLNKYHIFYELVAKRYSGNDEYHNFYNIGLSKNIIFGNIDFSENPIWRISWYKDGKYYHDSGFVNSNFDRLLKDFFEKCVVGYKKSVIDQKIKDIMNIFE